MKSATAPRKLRLSCRRNDYGTSYADTGLAAGATYLSGLVRDAKGRVKKPSGVASVKQLHQRSLNTGAEHYLRNQHKGSVHLTKLAPRQGKAVRLHVVLQRLWRVGRGFRA